MFARRRQHFPKQIFSRLLLQQLLGTLPILLLTTVFTRLYLKNKISQLQNPEEMLQAYDRAFFWLGLGMSLVMITITLWTSYRFVLPLGRILSKTRSILKKEYTLAKAQNADIEEKGEWSELESALHRINRDMQSKDRSLSREREEIEAILSALTEAVVAVDKWGNFLFYNAQFMLFFGERQKKPAGLTDVFRQMEVLSAFQQTMKAEESLVVETQLRLKTELQPRQFSLSVAPLRLDDGETYGAVGVFHDVSELKRMDQVRIDFVANVSHELRTPLTAIKGYAQTLREEMTAGSSSQKFLETIERNTDRLIALVHDLLTISSLESGTDLQKEVIDLEALTSRVVNQLDNLKAAKDHQLQMNIETKVLFADPKRIEQVLYNLLENAIKYVPAKGHICVSWKEEGNEVRLHVLDDGPGIPEEHHGRIFERFYRVDSARTREQGGTGLGLSIVKHIVLRHGGKVKVQAGPQKGTEFICTFPLEEG